MMRDRRFPNQYNKRLVTSIFISRASSLAMARTRLKPDWIAAWIGKPDSIQPGTRMPSYYPDLNEKSPYSEDFDGDAHAQIKAMRDYVVSIGKKK